MLPPSLPLLLLCAASAAALGAHRLVTVNDATLDIARDPESRRVAEDYSDEPLFVVGVHGSFRSGKSLLLNQLANASVFRVDNGATPVTRGLWLAVTEQRSAEGHRVAYLDSEGSGSFERGVGIFSTKISYLVTLLSSVVLVNTHDVVPLHSFLGLFEQTVVGGTVARKWFSTTSKTGLAWVIQRMIIHDDNRTHLEAPIEEMLAAPRGAPGRTVNGSFAKAGPAWTFGVAPLADANRSADVDALRAALLSSRVGTKRINGVPVTGSVVASVLGAAIPSLNRHRESDVAQLVDDAVEASARRCFEDAGGALRAAVAGTRRSLSVEALGVLVDLKYSTPLRACLDRAKQLFEDVASPRQLSAVEAAARRRTGGLLNQTFADNDGRNYQLCASKLDSVTRSVTTRIDDPVRRRYNGAQECRADLEARWVEAEEACDPRRLCQAEVCAERMRTAARMTREDLGFRCKLVSPVAIGVFLVSTSALFLTALVLVCKPTRTLALTVLLVALLVLFAWVVAVTLLRDWRGILVELLELNNRNAIDVMQIVYYEVCPEWVDYWVWNAVVGLVVFSGTWAYNYANGALRRAVRGPRK